jgi:hypothetical protein
VFLRHKHNVTTRITFPVSDIKQLIEYCLIKGLDLDMSRYGLDEVEIKNLESLKIDDFLNENMYILETKLYFRND